MFYEECEDTNLQTSILNCFTDCPGDFNCFHYDDFTGFIVQSVFIMFVSHLEHAFLKK